MSSTRAPSTVYVKSAVTGKQVKIPLSTLRNLLDGMYPETWGAEPDGLIVKPKFRKRILKKLMKEEELLVMELETISFKSIKGSLLSKQIGWQMKAVTDPDVDIWNDKPEVFWLSSRSLYHSPIIDSVVIPGIYLMIIPTMLYSLWDIWNGRIFSVVSILIWSMNIFSLFRRKPG